MDNENKKLSYNLERVCYVPEPYHFPKFKYKYEFHSQYFLEDIPIKEFFGKNQNDIKDLIIENLITEFRCSLNNVMYGDPAGRVYIEAIEEENKNKFGIDKNMGRWSQKQTNLVDDIAYSNYIKEKYKNQGLVGVGVLSFNQDDFIERKDENSNVKIHYDYAITLLRKEKIMKLRNGK